MAQVSGRRLRVQIACAALVPLILAATAAHGQAATDDGVSLPTTSPVASVTSVKTQVAMVSSDSMAVRAFQVSPEPEPDTDADTEAPDPPKASDPGGKVIYLTFDDGPTTRYTMRMLDLLDEYGAKATFFQVGENATAHPELTRAVVERGHALGNHTWSHRDMRRLSPQRLNHQIARTSDALQTITGRPITCLRPPFGAMNGRVKAAIRTKKLDLMLWDIDPQDWKRPGAATIARRVVSQARPGAVSLMHDGGGNRAQSVSALERILRALSKKGYRFATLPEC